MDRKSHVDLFGAVALGLFAFQLGLNQVVIKVTTGGFNPVFSAGVRSLGAVLVVLGWMYLRGIRFELPRAARPGAVVMGLLFAIEFTCLFVALEITSVSRASVIFYSMPVWLAMVAHVLLPGERLTTRRTLGLALALGGVALALSDRGGQMVSWQGDTLALIAAICWAGIALCVRVTPLSDVKPETQLAVQLAVSAPLLLGASVFFGPLLKDVQAIHLAGLVFQILAVASFGYLVWFWLMKIYPASDVASFSFLSPVFAVILGWLLLGEDVGWSIWSALGLVALGIILINRR